MSRTTTFRVLLLSGISALSLTACGGSGSGYEKTAAPMPPIAEMDAAMNETAPPPKPLPLSESDTLTPSMPAAPATAATAPATNSTMEARLATLEQSVNSLRSDYNRIMPAFASLNTTNERIQTLLDEMETVGKLAPPATTTVTKTETVHSSAPVELTNNITRAPGTVSTPPVESPPVVSEIKTTEIVSETTTSTAPAPAAHAETPAPETKAETAPAPSASASANTVTGVRIGEHGSKTRIVFDLTSKTKPEYKYDLDNNEKILVLEMPTSGWTAKNTGKPNSPLIAGWTSGPGTGGGSSVAIQLKKDARILSTEYLKAEGKDPARLVIDIAATK